MAISKLKTLFAKLEDTFNNASLSSLDTDYRVDAEDITWEPTQEFIERAVQLDVLGSVAGVIGGKGGKLSFKLGLRGTNNQATPSSPITLPSPFADVLSGASLVMLGTASAALDASTPDTTTQVKLAASPTPASLGYQDPSGNGSPLMGLTTLVSGVASGPVVARVIADSSSDPLYTITPAAPAAIPSTQSVVPSVVAFPVGEDAGEQTVTLLALGDGYQYVFTGCRAPPPKISGQAGKRIMMEFAFEVTSWAKTDYSVGTFPSLDLPPAILALGSPFYWKAAATQSTPVADFSFDWGAKLGAIASTEATDGKAGWVISELKPKLTVKPYYNTSWASDYAAGTVDLILMQLGTVGGSVVTLIVPAAQISKYPNEADVGGVVGHNIEFTCTINAQGQPGGEDGVPAFLGFF